jgi:hypothetical protein
MITTPSTTFTVVQHFTFAPTTANMLIQFGASMYINTPPGNTGWTGGNARAGLVPLADVYGAQGGVYHYCVGQVVTSSDAAAFNPNSTVLSGIYFPNAWSQGVGVPTVMGSARCVSAGIAVQYTGASLTASGTYTTAGVTVDVLDQLNWGTVGCTYQQFKNLPTATTTAINTMQGVALRRMPTSTARCDYIPLAYLKNAAGQPNPDEISPQRDAAQYAMMVMVNGLNTAVSNTFEVTFVGNYEGIPLTSTLSYIDVATSKYDPIAMAQASNFIEELPPTLPSADMALSGTNAAGSGGNEVTPHVLKSDPVTMNDKPTGPSPEVTRAMNSGSLLDQLIEGGSKVIDTVAPIAAKYGPMLAGLLL